jgi:predicted nucleic acid-binding protein
MRVYLDNCCYNRPFDEQAQLRVVLETLAKLNIQQQMRDGVLEYVWSSVLDFEISKSRFLDRSLQIMPWAKGAVINVQIDDSIRFRAKEFEANGLKAMDALHVACAEAAECDWFFTTDRGILKKARNLTSMRVANPVEFFGGD